MTHDELERTMEFILEHQAKSAGETEDLRAGLAELTSTVGELSGTVAALTADVAELKVTVRDAIEKMRESFKKLIVSNEATRDLATKIDEFALNNSRRLNRVEQQLH